jgi:hypothetical protein
VFDVSKVSTGQVTLETTIKIGETYVMGLHYDPAGDQVWVIGTDIRSFSRSWPMPLVSGWWVLIIIPFGDFRQACHWRVGRACRSLRGHFQARGYRPWWPGARRLRYPNSPVIVPVRSSLDSCLSRRWRCAHCFRSEEQAARFPCEDGRKYAPKHALSLSRSAAKLIYIFPAAAHFYWTRLDVNKLEWSNVTLDTLYPAAMVTSTRPAPRHTTHLSYFKITNNPIGVG